MLGLVPVPVLVLGPLAQVPVLLVLVLRDQVLGQVHQRLGLVVRLVPAALALEQELGLQPDKYGIS